MNTQADAELVAEIHEAFYSADERLLQEAKNLLVNPRLDKAKYAERVSALGFGSAKPVKEAVEIAENHLKAGELIKSIEYFRVYYPNNKFITEKEVKSICEKYGLLLGDAANYIGDIPEKNLVELEAFKLRKEDWTPKSLEWSIFNSFEFFMPTYFGFTSSRTRRSSVLADYFDRVNKGVGLTSSPGLIPTITASSWAEGVDTYKKDEPKAETQQAAFKICAPQKDFNTSGHEVKEGYRLVYDPVVLQPVKDGYLIVTAWGIEASDELVVNENSN